MKLKLIDFLGQMINDHKQKEETEAWRAGYIYIQRKLKEMSETMYNDEFTDAIIELSNK